MPHNQFQQMQQTKKLLISGVQKEVTKQMIYCLIGKHICQANKLGHNFQITLNPDQDTNAFLQKYNYKPVLNNPLCYQPYLNRQDIVHIKKYFIKNLNQPQPINEHDLNEAFSDLAKIHKIKLSYKRGQCLGYGQIHFYDSQGKLEQISKQIKGREITLQNYQKDKCTSNIVTFQLQMQDINPNVDMQTNQRKDQIIKDSKKKIAQIIPAGINYNISILFYDKTICLISIDASNSGRVQQILNNKFKFNIKYGKNRSPFLRLFVGNLKKQIKQQRLKKSLQGCLRVKVLKVQLIARLQKEVTLTSGDIFLAEAQQGKKVVTDSKNYKQIRQLFQNGKVYFNVKLPKKQKLKIQKMKDKYDKTKDQIKKQKDKIAQPKLIPVANNQIFKHLFMGGIKVAQ